MEPLLLKPEGAAEALGLSRSVIYQLIGRGPSNGGIDSVLIGRSRRISRHALEEFVERQRSDHAVN